MEKLKNPRSVTQERSYGEFNRSFQLPRDANRDSISAKVENGVLTVTIPKMAETKSKTTQIPIK